MNLMKINYSAFFIFLINLFFAHVDAQSLLVSDKTGKGCKVFSFLRQGAYSKWTGKCLNGYADGIGTAIIYDSSSNTITTTYEGKMVKGFPEGKGVEKWHSNDDSSNVTHSYEGGFHNGRYDGFGVEIFKGLNKTAGYFKNGELFGKFRSEVASGRIDEGYQDATGFTGNSIYTDSLGNIYTIEVRNNNYTGFGTIKYKDSSIYVGIVEEKKRNGKGILTFKNNSKYDGSWENDYLIAGKSSIVLNDTTSLNVNWVNGKREGIATVNRKNEKPFLIWFSNDSVVSDSYKHIINNKKDEFPNVSINEINSELKINSVIAFQKPLFMYGPDFISEKLKYWSAFRFKTTKAGYLYWSFSTDSFFSPTWYIQKVLKTDQEFKEEKDKSYFKSFLSKETTFYQKTAIPLEANSEYIIRFSLSEEEYNKFKKGVALSISLNLLENNAIKIEDFFDKIIPEKFKSKK